MMLSRLVIILCFILFPFLTTAQSYGDSETKAVTQIFKAIPIEGKLTETPQELNMQFSQNPFGLPASQNKQMMELFSEAFAANFLLADAEEAFHQNHHLQFADSALQWFNKETIKKVLEAEREFYTLQGIRKRVVNKYELEQKPAAESRIKLIQVLAKNMSAAESQVESQAIIFRAMISAFNELSNQQSFTETQIKGYVNNYRNQVQSQIDQELTKQLLLMYNRLENNVLKEYVTFYETGAGNWLSNTSSKSIHTAYRAATDRFLNSIRDL